MNKQKILDSKILISTPVGYGEGEEETTETFTVEQVEEKVNAALNSARERNRKTKKDRWS